MDTLTKPQLVALCKERGLKGYSTKNKAQLIELLGETATATTTTTAKPTKTKEVLPPPEKVCRLNYIGSKYQLLDWITQNIKERTGWTSFEGKTIADLFAGTGIVSYHFRKNAAKVISNDAELYSSIIANAFTCSTYTDTCRDTINTLQKELDENKYSATCGFVTTHYSPYNGNERKFFTIENAKRIDYLRGRIEEVKTIIPDNDYKFILASLIISADAVSNVPAVYGCFLKNFKAKANKKLTLAPIHTNTSAADGSNTYNTDVLNIPFLKSFESDVVYLDPPYNERQYSKNYFPLNIIAKTPEELSGEITLKGKTGIPSDCFISPFCKKGDTVEKAFDTLFRELKTKWIFLSYNSESIVSKEKILELMKKYGTATVIERDYKRFKSFEYNKDTSIQEYLFCLKKAL